MHPARSTSHHPIPTPFTAPHASPESPLSASLPPVPVEAQPLDTSCFDTSWERAWVSLANTLRERQSILQRSGIGETPTEDQVQKATAIAHTLNPLECRDRVVAFLDWQTDTLPEAPLPLLSERLSDKVLNESPSLSFIPEMASRIITSGFVDEVTARASIFDMQREIEGLDRILRCRPLRLLAITGVAYCAVHPLAAIGPGLATALALLEYGASSWERREYSTGYVQETFDTYLALSRGESPTIAEGIARHFNWAGNERYRADGYTVARTLRILNVPSSQVLEAYKTTVSVDFENQPLVNLLIESLERIGFSTSGCLAADYLDAKRNGGDLANALDALNSCYFLWGKRSARRSQHKMIELLTKGQ